MNIVVLAQKDFGNSGWQMVQAVRKMTSHRIHFVTAHNGRYQGKEKMCDYCISDYEDSVPKPQKPHMSITDVIASQKKARINIKSELKDVQKLINEADVIHWKGDWLPSDHFTRYLYIPKNKKTIVTVGGSGFRRKNKAIHELVQLEWHPLEAYKINADVRTSLTPDLNYPNYAGMYTQEAIDCLTQPNIWKNRKRPLIAHSPTHRGKKGTDLFLQATQALKCAGHKIDVDIIENVSKNTCIKRKKNATIFFDQVGVGFYGNAALEAMQFGIPTIAGIPEFAYKQSDGKINKRSCPVITVDPSVESIIDAIEKLLCPPPFHPKMSTLSQRTKTFCDYFHSYETVGKMWDKIYKGMKK